MKYFICKLNINENLFSDFDRIKNELIPKAINSYKNPHELEKIGNKNMTLSDINNEISGIITGKIYIQNNIKSDYYNDSTGTTEKTSQDQGKTNNFIYLIESEFLLLSVNKKDLLKRLREFSELIEIANEEIGNLEINPISISKEIRDIILNRKIISFKAEYIAPNDPKTAQGMFKNIEDLKATKAKESYYNKNGLSLTTENNTIKEPINNLLDNIEHGYGSVEIEDDNKEKITSHDNVLYVNDIKDEEIKKPNFINRIKNLVKKKEE